MEGILELSSRTLPLFLLVFFRITGIMMVAPVIGNRSIPPALKAFLALTLAAIFFPLVDTEGASVAANLGSMALAVLWEFSVGLLIGFAAALLFAGVQLAGHIVDQEMGLRMANVLDPVTNEGVSVVGHFKLTLAMIVYLLIDGHHFLLAALRGSFRAVPLLAMRLSDGAALFVADTIFSDLFRMAVQIAAPALVTLFLITIAMAFMARTVPEMNIFILGFALRVGVGFLVLLVGIGLFVYGFEAYAVRHERAVESLLDMMGGGS